jgi:hypothetical protein
MKLIATFAALLFAATATAVPAASEVAATFDVPSDFAYNGFGGKTLSFDAEQLEFLKSALSLSTNANDGSTAKISLNAPEALEKRSVSGCALCMGSCVAWSVHNYTGFYAL